MQLIIYDAVVLRYSRFYNESKPLLHRAPRFPSGPQTLYVRKLLVSRDPQDGKSEPNWEDLLPQCHNLQDLALWTPFDEDTLSILTSIIHSPLRTVTPPGLLRLSALIARFFPAGKVDFRHEIFKYITHLELLMSAGRRNPAGSEWAEGNNLGCLPHLRYLWIWMPHMWPMEVFKTILQECNALEVLVLAGSGPAFVEDWNETSKVGRVVVNRDGMEEEVPEDRVVVYGSPFFSAGEWTRAWYQSAVGGASRGVTGYDVWHRSEKIVQRRRQRRRLEAISWDSVVDSSADVSLAKWMIAMDMY
ncbi:hypothetical protein AX16_008228 [Volvariella volvacea WC 439]|nr:hypothetical protein AX16_008228 [Volvariella volvacea WC 439]